MFVLYTHIVVTKAWLYTRTVHVPAAAGLHKLKPVFSLGTVPLNPILNAAKIPI